jgi:hypothetical protein
LQPVAAAVKKNKTNSVLYIPAFATKTVNDLVLKICLESVFPGQRLLDLTEQVLRAFFGLTTFYTDKMVMMSLFSMMVDKTVGSIAFINSAILFENFKGTINSRLVHARHPALDMIDYLVCGNMIVCIVYDLDDQSSLRG